MNIQIAIATRNQRILEVLDLTNLPEGETAQSGVNPEFFDLKVCKCTAGVYDAIKPNIGGRKSPNFLESAESEKIDSLQNVYIENGSLKLI